MKKSKRLLALLLSVMLILGTVGAVPFTASAKEAELSEISANFVNLYEEKTLAETVKLDTEYIASVPNGTSEDKAVYATFKTAEAGYYEIWAKNENIPSETGLTNVNIVDETDEGVFGISMATGTDNSDVSRLKADTRYYVKLYSSDISVNNGGFISFKLSYFADPEPDEMKPDITVNAGKAYEGSIDVAGDKDWIFVPAVSDKKHSFTLENLNEKATAFKAEVYDTKNNLLDTVTTESENSVTVEFAKPSEVVSYYVCVTGINADVRGKYAVKMEQVAPKSVETPLNEDYYDSITGYNTEGGHDYLKFTTIDKDAYYTIHVKNIDINTHSWSKENGVQFVILNANSEEIDRVRLIPASEGSTTLKLKPDTTFYMQVYNHYLPDSNGGNYKINISYVLDPEKNDNSSCDEVKLEEKYYGNIAARGDSDWFRITTNEETDYTFTLKNTNIPTHSWSPDLRFRGVIYNDKNEEIALLKMFSGEELNTRVTLDPNTTYYICIWDPQGTAGEYSFDLSVTVIIDEEAVGMANAVELPFNEDYYDSITNWEGDNKTDYLKFTTLNESAYYTLTAKNINIPTHSWSGDNQVQVKVWNEHKEELGKLTLAEGSESSTTLLLDKNTTYFVRINNNENNGGNYKVNLSYVLDPEANELEQGMTLRIGERYYGNIAAAGDKDFFKITTNEETELTLLLKNINIPTHSWSGDHQFRAVLYNKYSEELGKILATNDTENNIKLTLEPNTTYYIGVWDPDNTTGDYNVILAESVLMGDVTSDGAVKIQDATLIQKALAKLAELDESQNAVADVTEDGKVNIKDATAIQKFLAKIETPYKTGQLILSEIEYSDPENKD
ncbi:MAG: dockerin type I repeat-containing protein [Clostridia bacterium]|nr:dockerin type I repeat-containing protein [Clostridia bacterium]